MDYDVEGSLALWKQWAETDLPIRFDPPANILLLSPFVFLNAIGAMSKDLKPIGEKIPGMKITGMTDTSLRCDYGNYKIFYVFRDHISCDWVGITFDPTRANEFINYANKNFVSKGDLEWQDYNMDIPCTIKIKITDSQSGSRIGVIWAYKKQ